MTIQPPETADIQQLLAIEQAVSPGPWTESMFAEELDNEKAFFYTAREAETVLGFGGFWNLAGTGHIANIAVHPEFQRRGVARRILFCMLDAMRQQNIEEAVLEVRAGNAPAIQLYEQSGFRQQGCRKGYYRNGDDALIYALKLP